MKKYSLLLVFGFLCVLYSFAQESGNADNLISKRDADRIKPAIRKWLDFYKLDIYSFLGQIALNKLSLEDLAVEEDTLSMYYRKYERKSDDVYQPLLYDYSPNKRFYLNLLETAGVAKEDEKWYYIGGDDCLEIYLADRKKGNKALVHWLGAGTFVEGVFWLDNKSYIIVGYEHLEKPQYFFQVNGEYSGRYYLSVDQLFESSYFRSDLELRGVICD